MTLCCKGVQAVETSDVTGHIEGLLRGHGLSVTRDGERVAVERGGLALQARAHHHERKAGALIQLDVLAYSATHLADRRLVESFVGVGDSSDAAIHDAVDKFRRAALHVLLASFVSRELGADQVEWGRWAGSARSWDVCLGPLLAVGYDTAITPEYAGLLDQMKQLFVAEAAAGVHWLRAFHMSAGATVYPSEALLDNAPWPGGTQAMDSWPWLASKRARSLRHFMIALPVA